MDFIFMLTRDDRTVGDCLAVIDEVAPLGLRHLGFKDIGVDLATMRALVKRIRELGATCYLEVVSIEPEACLASARLAVELGVDRLLGGTDVRGMLEVLAGTPIDFHPFPGRPEGHPTRLGGSPSSVAEQCREIMALGCAGADLLAYRATEADPLDLVGAARSALGAGRLIVAGSIDSPAKIEALAAAGADAFTVGSSVFEGSWAPDEPGPVAQLRAVLASCPGTGDARASEPARGLQPDPSSLRLLAQTRMPFGRYQGRLLVDLPEPYVMWFHRNGFPKGRLGELLRELYEIKVKGLESLLEPLKLPEAKPLRRTGG
ncbi:MAG: putative quorum-sensing-regulated virulence factor [Myxococcales bacterium]|jgi:uncharacterized protein (DUF3820 family)